MVYHLQTPSDNFKWNQLGELYQWFTDTYAQLSLQELKIQAAVTNAQVFHEIQKEYGSFSDYLWHWTDGRVIRETGKTSSELSDVISKDLKKRGMKFVGTTVVYAYLQAIGVIWSHEDECFFRKMLEVPIYELYPYHKGKH